MQNVLVDDRRIWVDLYEIISIALLLTHIVSKLTIRCPIQYVLVK
jgi:hypothetical protein